MSDEDRGVTNADAIPFLRMHPEAPLYVNVLGGLVRVRDMYYDNEAGRTIIEIDAGLHGAEKE